MKIVTVIGARPQFIKAAPFSKLLRKKNCEIIIHTGQHYDVNMSEIFFQELNIPEPDYNLKIGSTTHAKQTARMLEGIEEILQKEQPNGLLVYGDTNSTLAGALAASKMHIPLFHVEAGLRSYNKKMPEEVNRLLTDHISDKLFCPTQTAVDNLLMEGINRNVYLTGDIMYDAVLRNIEIAENKYSNLKWIDDAVYASIIREAIKTKKYYLATIHRAENTDSINRLKKILKAFDRVDKPVLLPIHPRTRKKIEMLNLNFKNIFILNPVGYLLMLYLTSNAYMVLTDSGGLQKEAYFLKTPCTTIREETEWIETLENNWNVLSAANVEEIVLKAQRNLDFAQKPQLNKFGDGFAAQKIYQIIVAEK